MIPLLFSLPLPLPLLLLLSISRRKILQDAALKDTGLSRVAVVEVLSDAIADGVFGSCALELDAMLGQMADTIFKTL